MVARGGKVRFTHVDDVRADTLKPVLKVQIRPDSMLMTDEASYCSSIGRELEDGSGIPQNSPISTWRDPHE